MDPELDNNDNKFNEEIIPKDDTINLDLTIEIDADKQLKEIDPIFVEELRENISRNSLEIKDFKSSNQSQISEDSNPTPRSYSDKNHPQYVYANTFDEALDDSEEWTDLKRYRFQKCLWKLKYNRIVSSFYLDNLKKGETKYGLIGIKSDSFDSLKLKIE